ncbi:PAS/PAC sensor signal transduction histidine kinase [Hymenobacter swuensis DY53]|uniref:histidine kinase n=2 Tax=Hymenobacter TaxID=89966 RepID=W8F725_9BACT|nr:PAS/PAC sensor signal transduction histidine kinase [Hymenobacter swuensis DY53]
MLEANHNPLIDILFEQAREFVGLYDVAKGWFVRVNPAGYRLLGYPSAQALYDAPIRSLQVQLSPAENAALREQIARTGHYELETELRRYSDQTFWSHVETTSLELDGQSYFLVRIADTNPLHAVERDLAQSVERFEAVFAHATIGIIVCDQQGSIVLANGKSRELFGYAEAELLGQRIEVLVPNATGRHHQQLRESFNARPSVRVMGAHRGTLEGLRQDGSVFPLEISLSYFRLDEELFVVAYIIDVTFKREAEQELIAQRQRVERLNADLERKVADRTHALMTTLEQLEQRQRELALALAAEQELGELKSRFVSMASHEFRTPLTAVLTSATLIEKYPAAEQQPQRQRHLDRIRVSVKHLTDILEEFLSVGKIEEGRIAARPALLELPTLVEEAVADVQGLRKPGQRIEQDLPAGPPMWLDTSLLRKVLVNLLSNALKYSGEHTVVVVRAACQAGQLTLQVQDQGVGISAEDQQHLFERFFRARNATNIPGTGLGLYIIGKYLELMGGTIDLRSELHMGTTITLTIPYENHPAD